MGWWSSDEMDSKGFGDARKYSQVYFCYFQPPKCRLKSLLSCLVALYMYSEDVKSHVTS